MSNRTMSTSWPASCAAVRLFVASRRASGPRCPWRGPCRRRAWAPSGRSPRNPCSGPKAAATLTPDPSGGCRPECTVPCPLASSDPPRCGCRPPPRAGLRVGAGRLRRIRASPGVHLCSGERKPRHTHKRTGRNAMGCACWQSNAPATLHRMSSSPRNGHPVPCAPHDRRPHRARASPAPWCAWPQGGVASGRGADHPFLGHCPGLSARCAGPRGGFWCPPDSGRGGPRPVPAK